MGQFLDDQLGNGKYFYCTANLRYPKEQILGLVLQYFSGVSSSKVHISDINNFLKKALNVERVSFTKLQELLKTDRFVSYDVVADLYEQITGKTIQRRIFNNPQKDKIQVIKPVAKAVSNNEEYYYCTKMVRFPLKYIVADIFNLFKTNNTKNLPFNDIYEYLRDKYNVKSFNRGNLINLLGSSVNVPFSSIERLYMEKVVSSFNDKDTLCIDLLEYMFIKNIRATRNVIKTLGTEIMIHIIKEGLSGFLNVTNSINTYFGNDKDILELQNPKKDKLLDKKNGEIFIDFISSFSDDDWIEILKDQQQIKDYLDMYIEEKKQEIEKEKFKSLIIEYSNLINKDNLNANTKYLFSHNIAGILQDARIYRVEDLSNIRKNVADKLYPFKDQLLATLKRLQISLPGYLNERYKYLIQMVNKDYKPNSLWEQYVEILEKRADGLTLEQSGSEVGVTRERVRQLEKKYLMDFNRFYNGVNGSLNNLIRTFVENPLFIQKQDAQRLFSFNPKLFMYFLENIEVEGLLYIEEIGKFYFVDDFDWYKELLIYAENLPEQINANQVDEIIYKALNLLKKNGVEIEYSDCKKIVIQDYKIIGSVYSKSNMNLGQKFTNILKTYFPHAVNIYDTEFLAKFRKIYYDIYKDDKIKTDHAISSVIARIGMLVGRGEYILNDRMFMSKELADKISNYIEESGREIFLTNNLFAIFEDELRAEGIYNKYFLQGAFRQRVGDRLYFRRDYISTTKDVSNSYTEILKFLKEQNRVVTYDELQEEFVGTPWNVLMYAIGQDEILNYRAKYVHIDAVKPTDEEIAYLEQVIINLVSDGKIHHLDDALAYIRLTNPSLLNKTQIEDQFQLYSMLEYLFEGKYEFKRPFVAQLGVTIENQAERINEFVHSNEVLSIDELIDFVTDNRLHLYSITEYIDSLPDYVFKDQETIINIDKTNLNKYNVEVLENILLKNMDTDGFLFADEFKYINILPKEVKWTPWLIYSAVNKFGREFKAIPSDTKFKIRKFQYARPLIIKRDIPANNINEFVEYLRTKKELDDTEFYKYLRSKGLA